MAEINPIPFVDPNRGRISEADPQLAEGIAQVAQGVSQGMDNRTEREFRENVQDTIDGVVNDTGTLDEVTVNIPERTGDEDVDNLRRRLFRYRELANQGGANARARARLLIKQELANEVARKPWMRDRLINAANQEIAMSAKLDEAELQSQAGVQAQGNLKEIKDYAVDELGLPAHVDITSAEGAAMYMQAVRHHEAMRQHAMIMEGIGMEADVDALNAEAMIQATLSGPDSIAQNASLQALDMLSGMMEYYDTQVARGGTVPSEEIESRFAIAKQAATTQLVSSMAELQSWLDNSFPGPARQTDAFARAEAQVNRQIQSYQRAVDAIEANDITGLKLFEVETEARRARKIRTTEGLEEWTDFQAIFGEEGMRIIDSSLSGLPQLMREELSSRGMQIVDRLYSSPQQALADIDSRGNTGGTIYTNPNKLRRALRTEASANTNYSMPRKKILEEEYQRLKAAQEVAALDVNTYSSPNYATTPLNAAATAIDRFSQFDTDAEMAVQGTLGFYADKRLRNTIDSIADDPNAYASLVNLGNVGEEYLLGDVFADQQTRNAQLQARLDNPIHAREGTYPVGRFLDLDQDALEQGRFTYRVNNQAIEAAFPTDFAVQHIAKRKAQETAQAVGNQITQHVDALTTIDKLQNPQGDYMPFLAAIEAYGFGEFLGSNTGGSF